MDWNAAIDINREALKRVLAMLVAMAGFGALPFSPCGRRWPTPGSPRKRSDEEHSLPCHLHRAVLRLLRPAEAAARRLIIVVARDIAVALPPPHPRKTKPGSPLFVRNGIGTSIVLPAGMMRPGETPSAAGPAAATRSASFALFDPLRSPFPRRRPALSGVPRIWAPDCVNPIAIPPRKPPTPGDPVDASRVGLRLAALASALDDLPKHAKRFARWRARNLSDRNGRPRDTSSARSRFRRLSPQRPGRPPGSVARNSRQPAHEVHDILARTHGLAFFVLEHRDTS